MDLHSDADSTTMPRWRAELKTYWTEDGPRFLHIVKVAMAATLAMGLSMRLELRTPATAMVSCVIVMMHQQSGMVIARGFYRGVGMVCGSMAGLALIACFPQQPLLFFIALAAWIGACVFGASYYRNFQSYGFVLTGYGTAITAMPAWSNPYGVFDNVVFTVSEVVIGVVCASVVSAVIFPQRVTPALYESSRRNFTNLLNSVHSMLDRASTVAGFDTFLDLIRERAGLESLRGGAVFEDPSIRLHNHVFLDLDRSFLDTVAWIHALHQLKARVVTDADPRALAAVDELLGGLLEIVPRHVETLAETHAELITIEQAETLSNRLDAFEQALPAHLGRLLQSLSDLSPHERQYVATIGSALFFSIADLRALCRGYVEARTVDRLPWSQSVFQAIGCVGNTRATANRTAALIAGMRAAVAVLVVGAAWLASGWVNGSSALVAVAITSALFALVPNPAVASWQIFCGCIAGWLAGFAFNFFLLPRFDSLPLLAASIAIFVMVGSYVNTFAKTSILGLGFNIYFCFIVGISNPTVYNPSAYLDTGFALLLGIATAAVAFSILVPRTGDWISAQYLKQIRALVAYNAREEDLDDLLFTFELSLRDFIIQIASAPADLRVDRNALIGWAFAALEIGRAMIQMRLDTELLGDTLPLGWPEVQDAWLAALGDVFASAAPQAADAALAATRRAQEALSLAQNLTVDAAMLTRCRMRALLHFTEMALQDDTGSFWRTTGAPT
ncbi:FUSC family protein [Caballeronia sordidicola]|uniref:Fusaric acid resistance protein fusb / fusaric acid resistance protein fusc n=1 Tax=Caballeronia sordidicola TaxID=196367 RepID=A0A226WPZ9_CABSO|nr:FUSC family protein [Caballeronia sordidicola]OXC72708.1 Fusaric acid resistance protein fusb / fusaric acid resistance protein fusc [Caballeronia sordidicola]